MFIAAIIAAALIVAATASSVYATQKQMDYNKKVARYEADAAKERASQEADRRRRLSRREEARIRAAFAGAGIDADFGSPFDLVVDQAVQGEISAQQALDEGNIIAWQRETERKQINFTGRQQQVTTLLQGASGVASAFSRGAGSGGGGSAGTTT